MRSETIARNYAEALFDLGERSGGTARYADLIDALAAAIETTPTVQAVLMSPRVPKSEKSRLLGTAMKDAPREFVLFLQAVVKRGRQHLLREIATEYAASNKLPICSVNTPLVPKVLSSVPLVS